MVNVGSFVVISCEMLDCCFNGKIKVNGFG